MISNWRIDRFWDKVAKGADDECWEFTGAISGNGYGKVCFTIDPLTGRSGPRVDEYAHRLAWATEHGRWPKAGLFICHSCDNGLCCNPAHLREDTPKSNCNDRAKRSNWTNQPKLTDQEVQAIRASEATQIALARRYGVSQTTINNVRNGRRYADV